jgi:DNA-binding XRE family transcriptional regulator
MQAQDNAVGRCCAECNQARLLDEHDRCERCVRDAESRSALLASHEETLTEMVEAGFTPDQLHETVDKFLTAGQGRLTGDFIERDDEGWAPVESAFLAGDRLPSPNRLRGWRVRSGWTLEELADRLDVDPATVAVWESGADVPDEVGEVYSELFGVSVAFLLGRD